MCMSWSKWPETKEDRFITFEGDMSFSKETKIAVPDGQSYYKPGILDQINKNNKVKNESKTYVEIDKWNEKNDTTNMENWKIWEQSKLEKIADRATLLQRVKNKIWIDGLDNLSPENFIKAFDKLKTNNQLSAFYIILQQDETGTLSDYMKSKLSLDDRIKILDEISDTVLKNSKDIFSDRNQLMEKLVDKKEFLKNLILNTTNLDRNSQINKIQKYFIPIDIIKWFGYKFWDIRDNLLKKAIEDREILPSNYTNLTSKEGWREIFENETVTRFFMLKILNAWEGLQKNVFERKDENEKNILSEKKKNILLKKLETWGIFVWFSAALSSLNNDQLKRLNWLSDDWFEDFLNKISNNETIKSRITTMEDYNVGKNNASEIACLIDMDSIVVTQMSDYVALLKNGWILDEHSDYDKALNIEKQSFAKSLYLLSQPNGNWDDLPDDHRQIYIDKWNNLSKEEKDKKVSERIISIIKNNFNSSVIDYAGQPAKVTEIIKQQREGFEKSISRMNISEEKKSELLQEINKISENSNKQLYQSAQKYWFIEDLRQVRWEEYFYTIQKNIVDSQNQEIQKYSQYPTSKSIQTKLRSNLENIDELNTVVDKTKLQWNLTNETYKKLLGDGNQNQENPSTKELNLNENEKKKQNLLLATANETIKNEFIDRLQYFLINILNVQISEWEKENILKNLKMDDDKQENKTSKKITIKWIFNDTNLAFDYDIESWVLNTNSLLSVQKRTDNISFNTIEKLKNIKWPVLWEYKSVVENINYSNILNKTSWNVEMFWEDIKNQIFKEYPRFSQSSESAQEIQKRVLENVVAQEIFDMMWVSGKMFLNKWTIDWSKKEYKQFPLIARTLSSYDVNELNDFRNVTKFMEDFYQKIEQIENSQNVIENKLIWLAGKVFPRYKKTKEYVQKLFVDKERNKYNSNYTWEQFYAFFSSFSTWLERVSEDWKKIIDPVKLEMFQNDLEQKAQQENSKTWDYMNSLERNIEIAYLDQDFENNLEKLNKNTNQNLV